MVTHKDFVTSDINIVLKTVHRCLDELDRSHSNLI